MEKANLSGTAIMFISVSDICLGRFFIVRKMLSHFLFGKSHMGGTDRKIRQHLSGFWLDQDAA